MAANTRGAVCSALPSSSPGFNKKKAPVGSFSKYCENYREIWLDCNGGVQVPRGDLLPRHQGEVPLTVLYCTVLYWLLATLYRMRTMKESLLTDFESFCDVEKFKLYILCGETRNYIRLGTQCFPIILALNVQTS